MTAGVYSVTVRDSKGCIDITTATVEENTTLTATAEVNNAVCNGTNTGSIILTVEGGTPNYTYVWSNGSTTKNLNNIPAGVYSVTVTDALGCKAFRTVTVGQPAPLTPTAVVANVSCFGGENGAINITVTGGTPDYTYAWSNGATTEDLNGISAGTYTLTITDANGCFVTISRVVTQPPVLNPTLVVTNVTCFGGSNGAIDLTVAGGTPTYTYLWSNGATTQDLNNIGEGTYLVTITDMNGCTAERERTITQPPAIEIEAISEPVTACNGGNDGSITLTVSGGTPGYTYNWADLQGSIDPKNRPGLTAGNYTVTVTDARGCTAVEVVTVGQVSGIELVATPTPTTCEDGTNGSVNLTVSGGTPGYTYLWSNGASSQNISGLAAGNYSVTVTDQDGCTAVTSAIVTEPVIVLTIITTPVSCRTGADGAVDLIVEGGTPGYTYQWSNGATTQDLTGLTAGTYFVTVRDANGCSKTRTANVTQPTALNLSVTPSQVSCNGGANGAVNLTVSGGTPDYTYLWSNGSTTQDLSTLQAGTYTVTVTDANGCTATTSVTVNQPPVISLSAVPTGPACFGGSNAGISLTVNGGTPGYTYLWSNGSTQKNPNNLAAGTYTVTVTDSKGCTATTSATIINSPEIILSTDVTNILCAGGSTGAINLSVSGGVSPFTYNWAHIAGVSNPEDVSNLSAGTYTVTVTDANTCTKSTSATITQPPAISLSATTTNVSCFGGSNGSVNLSVSGGTPGYTYKWSNGANTEDVNGLNAGSYTVTVTDANACTKALTVSVTQPTSIQVFIATAPPGCQSNLASLATVVTGGTPTYTFQWSNGSTSATQNEVPPGSYTVTVMDANGCTAVKSTSIANIEPLSLSATVTPISCPGGSNGAINLTVSGGSGNFQYAWTGNGFFAQTQDINNISTNIYTVVVTDLTTFCTATLFRVISSPPALNLTTDVSPAGCAGANGTINLSVSGGTPQYQYLWSNGQTTQDIGGLLAGTYTVTVTDSRGCTKSTTATVTGAGQFSATATTTPTTCGGSNGSITVVITGGAAPYSWTGAGNGTSQTGQFTINALAGGTYNIVITDASGCSTTVSATVPQTNGITASAVPSAATCGAANGSVTIDVTGGTGPYTWSGAGNGTAQTEPFTISGLAGGTYSIVVTDANGCSTTVPVTVPQTGGITATGTPTTASCGASNGTISVNISGGTAPYTWTGANQNGTAQSTQFTISGLTGGQYCITVTSANGCTAVACATVPQTNGITATASTTPASCFGGLNGTITVDVAGGTPNYSYNWSTGATTGSGGPINGEPFTITGLAAGVYSVTVTNGNGCTAVVSATVGQPAPFTVSATPVSATCLGNNGSILVDVTGGGAAPYTWTTGLSSGSSFTEPFTISGLIPLQYCVTVTNANGCTAVACATVSQANGITATATPTPATCGDINGTITVDVTGGSQPYSYQWNNGNGQGSGQNIASEPFTISNLSAGMYVLTVTSSNGCTATATATITQTSGITASATATPAGCNGQPGKITVTVVNGTPNYTYNWSGTSSGTGNSASPSFMIQNLQPGTYNLTVKDGNDCMAMATVVVTQAQNITATATSTPATCNGGQNGTITVDVAGGTPNYNYNWTNGTNSGSGGPINGEPFTITALAAGNYSVTVTNGNGCTAVVTATVGQPAPLTMSATAVPATCLGNNGSITVDVTGGGAPYTWNTGLSSGSSFTEPFTISGLIPLQYCVTVTNANGCTTFACVTVSQPNGIAASATATPATCNASNGTITVDVTGGTAPYTWTGAGNGTAQNEPFTVSGLAGGNYCITVTDANGCTAVACANVTTSGAITVAATVVPTPCGITASTVQVNVSGGSLPYAYNWTNSNGGSGQLGGINMQAFVITNLAAGTISITVTDANGCSAVTSVIVTQFQALSISATATGPGCGGTTGSATIDVTAGGNSGPYTYNWVSGSNVGNGTAVSEPFTVSGLAPGLYSFTVKNAFNCTATTSVVVPPSGGGSLQLTTTHVCAPTCSGTNGEFGIYVQGGTAPYTYSWTGPINGGPVTMDTVKIMGLLPGSYTITVTDAGGCSATTTAVMLPPTEMFVAAVPTCATVCGGDDGKITVGVLFGMSNYTYNWSNGTESGSGTATTHEFVIGGLSEGTYTITVTGSDGCSEVVTTVVEPISSIVATAIASGSVGCEGSSTGNIIVNVSNGTPSYTYTWSNGTITGNGVANGNMFTISNVGAGTYSITLTDANGCTGVTGASIGGNIGGVVFNDYNTDGFMADTEPGLDSVLVYLYECNIPVPVDSVWTDANGAYTFPNLGNFPYRVEFVPVVDSCWIKPAFVGTQSGSTVQFIESANCNVKVGFFYPGDYCQNAPDIAFSCFAQGKTDDVTSTVIGLVPYNAIDRTEIFGDIEANELVGSVYGLAYDRSRHYLYGSAFLKRHVGLGSLGLGGIYRIDYSDTINPQVVALYTVPNVGSVIRPADLGAPNAPSMDTDAFAKIGKVGLGDIDISDDENTLWTINLFNRTLVRIDDVLTTPTSTELAIASAPTCDNGVFRPLAVKANRNKIYVGGVCTGENSGAATDLSASVHEYDVKKNMWKMILSWDLHAPNYNHGDIVGSVNQNLAQCREWETWVDVYTERNLVANTGSGEPSAIFDGNFEIVGGGPTGAEFRCRGQALISDIEITREGMMVIAMMDRTGHQFGYRQHRPTTTLGNPISASAGGDVIAAYPVNGVWTLENNGTVPGLNRTSLFGPNSNDGLGGGEYFYDNTRFTHLDADCGGLLYVPGEDELLSAINNPNTSEYNFGGGIVYYDLKLGNTTRNDLTLLDPTANTVGIGMANSIGDLEALCEAAPIQIGNYVWNDANADGVQDACENPIPGVTVSLYDATSNALLATTTTNAKGEYYFTGIGTPGQNWISTPGRDSIHSLTAYQIVFGTNGSVSQFNTATGKLTVSGTDYELTIPNVGAGWYKDWNDSDATIADAANKPWNDFPSIAYTTGMAGCSDHTLDAGFVSDNLAHLEACAIEAGSNLGQFNLTEADDEVDPSGNATVTYHLTAAQAQNGQGSLSSPYTGANGTQIYARVVSGGGGIQVVPVSLQVNPLPVAHVGVLKVCPDVFDGMMGTFNLNNANAQVTNGVSGLTVTYYDSQSQAALGTSPLPASYNSATKYIWARVENASGCYDVDILQLVVLSSPGVALNVTDNTCTGSQSGEITATITDGPANYKFVWSTGVTTGPGAVTSSTIVDLEAGVYTVTVTDGNACTAVSTAEVEDAIPFSIIPIPNYGPVNAGTQIGPIVLQTTTWGADFSWTGGVSVGLANGTATSLLPLILPFNTTVGAATVTVTATLGACSDTEEFTISVLTQVTDDNASVAGLLMTEEGEMVEEGYVELEGQMLEQPNVEAIYLTDDDGHFMFDHSLPMGANYTLTPTKDDNPSNGVTTYDLVVLEKHILALELLNSPYKLIAADANRSGSVTTFDIIELRKLILGIYTDLPNNTSWRFVDHDYVFPNPLNPFESVFPENKSFENIASDHMADDFIAVKIGDLNNSALPNSLMSVQERSQGMLLFDVDDRMVQAGETFTVSFATAEQVKGYQFTMNTGNLEVLEILPGEQMDATNFAVFAARQAVTTSWSVGGHANFAIRFRATTAGKISDMLAVSGSITKAEAYSPGNEQMQIGFRFHEKDGGVTLAAQRFELYQNQPNPFIDRTVIGFFLPEATTATLSVFDETGRLLHTQKGDYAKGYNAVTLEGRELDANGVLYYKVTTPTNSATRTMIQTRD